MATTPEDELREQVIPGPGNAKYIEFSTPEDAQKAMALLRAAAASYHQALADVRARLPSVSTTVSTTADIWYSNGFNVCLAQVTSIVDELSKEKS